jgi:hypothetical protein
MTTTVLCLVGVFYLCWAPFIVVTLLAGIRPNLVNPMLHELTKPLLLLNGALNPIIYASRMPAFRKAFKKFWRC